MEIRCGERAIGTVVESVETADRRFELLAVLADEITPGLEMDCAGAKLGLPA
jgi:hypothetical protein